MKKKILIIIGIIIGIILLDSIQALVFDNNPIIGIQTRNMKKVGILVDTHHCGNGKHDTVIKGFSYSCSTNDENYKLVDKSEKIKDFACDEALDVFYEDENYTYNWSCIMNEYMVVVYGDGSEELISEALLKGHIDIQTLDKFNISYYKEEKMDVNKVDISYSKEINDFIIEYFSKEEADNSNLVFNYVDEETNVVRVGLLDNSEEKQEEFIYNVFSNCCGSTYIEYIKYIKENKIIKFEKAEPNQNQ